MKKSKMKDPSMSGMGLQDESLQPGKMVKPKKAFMGLAVEAAKNPVSLIGLAAKNKMGLIGGIKKLKDKYFAKGGLTKSQKKIGKVMREFKAGKLKSGMSDKKVTNPKQAIAIALSEAGKSKMKKRGGGMAMAGMGAALQEGGMVRGSGAAIKGVRKAKMY